MSTETKISPREDGPLVVTNPPVLRDHTGADVETKGVAALCRCGLSKSKPFCDGSHNEGGFKSAPEGTHPRNTSIAYTGEIDGNTVTVEYTPMLCSHAAECQRLAMNVFNPKAKPWIQPENGSLQDIVAVMGACPSGALRLRLGDGSPHHVTSPEAEITIEKNGPYWVQNVAIEAEFNGVGASRGKYVLCRCGQSKNKPFCDGSHYDVKWQDDT